MQFERLFSSLLLSPCGVLVGAPHDLLGPELPHHGKAQGQGDVGAQEVALGAHVGHHLQHNIEAYSLSGGYAFSLLFCF